MVLTSGRTALPIQRIGEEAGAEAHTIVTLAEVTAKELISTSTGTLGEASTQTEASAVAVSIKEEGSTEEEDPLRNSIIRINFQKTKVIIALSKLKKAALIMTGIVIAAKPTTTPHTKEGTGILHSDNQHLTVKPSWLQITHWNTSS